MRPRRLFLNKSFHSTVGSLLLLLLITVIGSALHAPHPDRAREAVSFVSPPADRGRIGGVGGGLAWWHSLLGINTAYASTSTDSLVGYWKFDEGTGTTAADSSGEGNTGTLTGGPTWSASPTNSISFTNPYALDFDGTDDYVRIPAASSFAFGTGNFTISQWVYIASSGDVAQNGGLVSHYVSGSWFTEVRPAGSNTYGFYDGAVHRDSGISILYGQWVHFVVTREGTGSNQAKMYVDGTQVYQWTNDSNYSQNTNRLMLGAIDYDAYPTSFRFTGKLDDVRIYNRALSATEITDLAAGTHTTATWDGSSSTNWEVAANWDINAVPDPYTKVVIADVTTQPIMTANTGLNNLTINSGATLDLAGYNLTQNDAGTFVNNGNLLINNTETLTNFTNDTDSGTIVQKGTANSAGLKTGNAYNNLYINDGLVGYWKLDGNTNDSSGYGNTGTANGDAASSSTVPTLNFTDSNSYTFDGTGDYVDIADADLFDFGTGSFTVSAWINTSDAVAEGNFADMIVSKYSGGTWGSWILGMNKGDGTLGALRWYGTSTDNNSVTFDIASSNTVNDGSWHHVVGVRNASSTTAFVYVDGVQKGSGTADNEIISNAFNVRVGFENSGSTDRHFNGKIDDVRIYNRALTAQEVQALSVGNQPGTSAATTTLEDALDVNGNLVINSGTLDTKSGENNTINVVGNWENNGGVFTPRSGTVTFDGTASGKTLLSGGQSFNNATFSGNGGAWTLADRLDVDGTLTISHASATLDASTSNYVIHAGAWTQSAGTFTARSGTVVLDSASNSTFTPGSSFNILRIEDPTENGLVGYWKFDEENTTTAKDSSGNGNTGTLTNTPSRSESVGTVGFDDPYSLSFDGTDDYVAMGTGLGKPTSYTIGAWIRPSDAGDGAISAGASNGADGSVWGFIFRSAGTDVELWASNGTTAQLAVMDDWNATQYPTNQWIHIAGTVDGSNLKFYKNGVLTTTVAQTVANSGTPNNFSIGRVGDYTDTFYFGGLLDDVRIYNRALSAQEVTNLAAGRYASGSSSTATQTLGAALTATTLALDSGQLAAAANALTVTNLYTAANGNGTLTTSTSGSTSTFNGGITVSGATITGSTGAVDVNGAVTLSSGTLTAPSGTMTVSSNFDHSGGTFTHNSGTVTLDGADQTISGASTFNNLTKSVTTARTLTFPAATTQTIAGTMTLNGASGQLLSLRSSSTGTQWSIDPQGTRTISYLDVKDSNNINATAITATGLNITNSLNNTNWSFLDNPTLSSTTPTDNATAVATTANLVLTFNLAVDVEAGAANDITIKKTSDNSTVEAIDAQSGQVTGTGTTTITVNPTANLAEQTSYYVQVGADAFDNSEGDSYAGIADTTTWNFTTADETNPQVSTLNPLDNAVAVATTSNLILTFSEAVDVATGNITIKKTSDNSTVETIGVTSGNVTGTGTTIITINPTTNLAEQTEYYLQIDATAFDDVNGNSYAGITDTTTWSFTTADESGSSTNGTMISGDSGNNDTPLTTPANDIVDQAQLSGVINSITSGIKAALGATIALQPGQRLTIITKPVDADQVQSVILRVFGKTYTLTLNNQDPNNPVYVTTITVPNLPGNHPYTITANYGTTTRSSKGVFAVAFLNQATPVITTITLPLTNQVTNFSTPLTDQLTLSGPDITPLNPDQALPTPPSYVKAKRADTYPTIITILGQQLNQAIDTTVTTAQQLLTGLTTIVKATLRLATNTALAIFHLTGSGATTLITWIGTTTANGGTALLAWAETITTTGTTGVTQLTTIIVRTTGHTLTAIGQIFQGAGGYLARTVTDNTMTLVSATSTLTGDLATIAQALNPKAFFASTTYDPVTDDRIPDHLKQHVYEDVTIAVVDNRGAPLAGALVTLASTPVTIATTPTGQATFHDVHIGEHTLAISFGKYSTKQTLFLNQDASSILVSFSGELVDGVNPVITIAIALTTLLLGGSIIYFLTKRRFTGHFMF